MLNVMHTRATLNSTDWAYYPEVTLGGTAEIFVVVHADGITYKATDKETGTEYTAVPSAQFPRYLTINVGTIDKKRTFLITAGVGACQTSFNSNHTGLPKEFTITPVDATPNFLLEP